MNNNPSINKNNRPNELFEPHIPNLTPRFESKQDIKLSPNDTIFNANLSQDLPEHIDIKAESIKLALSILNITKSEYNVTNLNQLKKLKSIHNNNTYINALNILIYYKQNSENSGNSRNLPLPEINPIQHTSAKQKINHCGNEKTYAKIYPEIH